MQLLYGSSNLNLDEDDILKKYDGLIQQSYKLYLFNLATASHVAKYAYQDKENRISKLLPSEADKKFQPKLASNDLTSSIILNDVFAYELETYNVDTNIEESVIKRIYSEFVKTSDYKTYYENEESKGEDDKAVLLALYKFCLANVVYEDLVDDRFNNWEDDKSLVVGAVKRTLKGLPLQSMSYRQFKPNKETTQEFGHTLLETVLTDDADLLAIIEPNLKNWDADRVAIIDMILLKMAIAELLNFPSIPMKVTLNEYVEIAKLYSTDKSKDFINGILDRLMKKLDQEGKITKEGRGLIE